MRFGVGRLRVLDEDLRRPDAHLVQDAHGHRQGQLRNHVRWRHDRSDDERHDDEVAAKLLELVDRHHPDTRQHDHGDRHLEGDAEDQKQGQHEAEVLLDIRRGGDGCRGERLDELAHPGDDQEIAERHPGDEEEGA